MKAASEGGGGRSSTGQSVWFRIPKVARSNRAVRAIKGSSREEPFLFKQSPSSESRLTDSTRQGNNKRE